MSKPKTRVPPHLFVPPPPGEVDLNGRGACGFCHLVGAPGDTHHTLPEAPTEDVQRLAAGEREDG